MAQVIPFKAAVIGMGAIAPMHIKPLESLGIPIIAVCDTHAEAAQSAAEKIGAKAYTSLDEMLDAGGFDVLHICLPHYLHAPTAIQALAHGVHVLCEKPMATTVADAEKMLAAAMENNVYLGIIFQNRYSPGASLIKKTITSGKLGQPQKGWLKVTWNRGENYYRGSDWKGRWDTEGGGALINQSIHTFDLMNYFLGNPTSVSGFVANRANPYIEVEDTAEGMIMYGENGDIPVSFYVTNHHPYNAPATLEIVFEHGTVTLTGEDAVIAFNDGQKEMAGADTEAQQQFGMKSYWGVSHIKQIRDFYQSLTEGKPPVIDGVEGLRTQRLINGIYDSAQSKQRIMF